MTDLYLRTSLRPETKTVVRKKSVGIALLAAIFMLASEYLLPWLELGAFLLFSRLVGTGALGISALWHQRLLSQEKRPDILHSTEEALSFFKANKSLFTLSWQEISAFHFLDTGNDYGLAFTLKSPLPNISDECRKEHGVDLFLPYFSHASFLMLQKWREQHVVTG